MMEEQKVITEEINYYYSLMEKSVERKKMKKFIGNITERILRKHLLNKGFNVSLENVFIDRLGKEIDLLLLKKGIDNNKLIYKPEEVHVVFEIKYNSIGWQPSDIPKLNELYDKIKILNKNIKCTFITILEASYFKKKISRDNSPWEIFAFYYYKNYDDAPHTPLKLEKLEDKEGWNKLLVYLNKIES